MKIQMVLVGIVMWSCASDDDATQPPPPPVDDSRIQWQKTLGGSATDELPIIHQTADGGYILTATTFSEDGDMSFLHSPGHSDAWLAKLDQNAEIEWEHSLGGTRSELPTMVLQLNDGGYLLGACTNSSDGDINSGYLESGDWWIVRLDATGNILWERTLGGTLEETPSAALQLGNEFLIAGTTASSDHLVANKTDNSKDLWLVRLDDSGNPLWERTFGMPDLEEAGMALLPNQDGFMVAAEATDDIWLVSFDSEFNVVWDNYYGGSNLDQVVSMIPFAGGFTVLATSQSSDQDVSVNNGNSDIWVFHIDNQGAIQWERSYGGGQQDEATGIISSSGGGYWITGVTQSSDGDLEGNKGRTDYWVLELDSNGGILWNQNFGGSSWDQAQSVAPANGNRVLVAGSSSSEDGDVDENIGFADIWLLLLE